MAPRDSAFDLENRNEQMYHSPDVSAVRDNLNLDLNLEEQIKVQQLRTDLQDNMINSWEERIGSVTAWYNGAAYGRQCNGRLWPGQHLK